MAEESPKIIAVEKSSGDNAMTVAALMNALNSARNNPAEMLAILNNKGIGGKIQKFGHI